MIRTAAGNPASGSAVGFDVAQTSSYETTTNSAGQFSLQIPSGAVTGNDKISVADSAGNVWYDGAVNVDASAITVNITLSPFDTVSGVITQASIAPAANYEVRFVTADTSVNTGLYWSAATAKDGSYTLNIPVSIVEGAINLPVITGVDNLYINSYSSSTMDVWDAVSAPLASAGGSSYALSETLPASPLFTVSADAQPYFKTRANAAHPVAIEKPNSSLRRANLIKSR